MRLFLLFYNYLKKKKKKVKRKVKVVKKRQKIIPVLSLSLLLSLLLLATPAEPSVDKYDEGEDKDIEEPVEVEDENVGLPSPPLLPPLLVYFISV